jgi:hypothetical protein
MLQRGLAHPWAAARHVGETFEDAVTLSDGLRGAEAASVLVETAILDHHFDHHCTLSGAVRCGSPSFRMPVDLRRWTPANSHGPAAVGWGFGDRQGLIGVVELGNGQSPRRAIDTPPYAPTGRPDHLQWSTGEELENARDAPLKAARTVLVDP